MVPDRRSRPGDRTSDDRGIALGHARDHLQAEALGEEERLQLQDSVDQPDGCQNQLQGPSDRPVSSMSEASPSRLNSEPRTSLPAHGSLSRYSPNVLPGLRGAPRRCTLCSITAALSRLHHVVVGVCTLGSQGSTARAIDVCGQRRRSWRLRFVAHTAFRTPACLDRGFELIVKLKRMDYF